MRWSRLNPSGLVLFEPQVLDDPRGSFFESFNERVFREATGFDASFVQDNQSVSRKGVLRGLHMQVAPRAQGKLVRVVSGAVFDVALDMRRSSPTCGRWAAVELSAEDHRQLWIPPGFAHGFLALADNTVLLYKVTDFWSRDHERTIRWDDPGIGIDWPLNGSSPILSDKDARAPGLEHIATDVA
jgi:dTDP-4-dehydrorhamnose 3,5-epimerase